MKKKASDVLFVCFFFFFFLLLSTGRDVSSFLFLSSKFKYRNIIYTGHCLGGMTFFLVLTGARERESFHRRQGSFRSGHFALRRNRKRLFYAYFVTHKKRAILIEKKQNFIISVELVFTFLQLFFPQGFCVHINFPDALRSGRQPCASLLTQF